MKSDRPFSRFRAAGFSLGLIFLALVFYWSLTSGTVETGASDLIAMLTGSSPQSAETNATNSGAWAMKRKIISTIRFPRALSAVLAGMILGMAGAVFQCLLRNDLADPYVLGVSAGGAVGAVGFMLLGFTSAPGLAAAAFTGACLTMAAVYGIARGKLSSQTLIVAGIMVNATLSSLISLLVYLSPNVKPVMFWLMGSFSGSGREGAVVMALCAAALLAAGMGLGRWMDALAFGDATAASLGVRVKPMRVLLFFLASCASGAVVAFHGVIGFAGLMAPHFARSLIGPCHRALFPASALFGGLFLCLTDTISRTALSPEELPIGVVTGLVGGPFFISVLRRRRDP